LVLFREGSLGASLGKYKRKLNKKEDTTVKYIIYITKQIRQNTLELTDYSGQGI